MTKDQFLNGLRDKLKSLSPSEIEDIVSEFDVHIQTAIHEGKSEQDVIKSFGDLDELVSEILGTTTTNKSRNYSDNRDQIHNFVDKVVDTTKDIVDNSVRFTKDVINETKVRIDSYESKNGKDYDGIIRLLLKIMLIAIAVTMLISLVNVVTSPIFWPISWIFGIFIWFGKVTSLGLFIAVVVLFIIKVVEQDKNKPTLQKIINEKTTTFEQEKTEETPRNSQVLTETPIEKPVIKETPKQNTVYYQVPQQNKSVVNTIIKVLLITLILILLSPFIVTAFGLFIASVFSLVPTIIAIVFLIMSYFNTDSIVLIYASIILFGAFILEVAFIKLAIDFIRFVFYPKNKNKEKEVVIIEREREVVKDNKREEVVEVKEKIVKEDVKEEVVEVVEEERGEEDVN